MVMMRCSVKATDSCHARLPVAAVVIGFYGHIGGGFRVASVGEGEDGGGVAGHDVANTTAIAGDCCLRLVPHLALCEYTPAGILHAADERTL
jgi:hypothetical protein